VRASLGLDYDLYYRAAWVGWLALAPLVQIIFVLRGDPRRARAWGRVLYAMWGTILVLCLTTDLVEVGAVSLQPFVDRVGPLEQPARMLGAITLCYVLVAMYRAQRASTGRRRQQTGYFLLGAAFYACAGLFLAGLFQVVGGVRFDPGLVGYFSLGWMALTVYAIMRHRLFDIRFVLSRGVQGVVLTTLLAALNIGLFHLCSPVLGTRSAVAVASVLTAVAFFMTPLVGLARRATDYVFVRHRYDYTRALKESAQALAALSSVDGVLHKLLEVTRETMGITSGALLLLDEDGRFVLKQSYGLNDPPAELAAGSALSRWLAERAQIFIRDEQEVELAASELDKVDADLRRLDGEVALSLRFQGALRGILVLGRKRDRDAFLQIDVDLLETLATEAAIALANAQLLEDVQQAVRMRDDFLSVAGHELRTPLTALQLNVQILLRTPPTPETLHVRLTAIERQVLRLERLTEELLDVSRIGAHRLMLEREDLDLSAIGQEVAARFTDELRRAGSELELRPSEPVVGCWDRVRVEQVVTNLLTNAIKYGEGKPISMSIERGAASARLTVRDQGIGIDEEDQLRIFERFERAVSLQHYGGFGLGLWITKQVVDAHGGTIEVRSERGRGSTFVIELPLNGTAS
jgi:signal transduction histidine kinase